MRTILLTRSTAARSEKHKQAQALKAAAQAQVDASSPGGEPIIVSHKDAQPSSSSDARLDDMPMPPWLAGEELQLRWARFFDDDYWDDARESITWQRHLGRSK